MGGREEAKISAYFFFSGGEGARGDKQLSPVSLVDWQIGMCTLASPWVLPGWIQLQQVVSPLLRVIRRKYGRDHTVLWAGEVRECGRC